MHNNLINFHVNAHLASVNRADEVWHGKINRIASLTDIKETSYMNVWNVLL